MIQFVFEDWTEQLDFCCKQKSARVKEKDDVM